MQLQNTTWEDLKIVADPLLHILCQDTPVQLDHHVKKSRRRNTARSFHTFTTTRSATCSLFLDALYNAISYLLCFLISWSFFLGWLVWLLCLSLMTFFHALSDGSRGKRRICYCVRNWLDIPWRANTNTPTKLCVILKRIPFPSIDAYMNCYC